MKLLFSLFIISIIAAGVYFLTSKWKKNKKNKNKAIGTAIVVAVFLLGLLTIVIYRSEHAPDIWCGKTHVANSSPPASLLSAMDYFQQGNYDYDIGKCEKSVNTYKASIKLDPNNPQVFNNRAYTYMRLRNYEAALQDLKKALQLRPDYINALMNRADIHNYYYQINRKSAIIDYKKALSLGASQKETSVCGHLFLAEHNGWNLGTFLDIPRKLFNSCD